MLFSVSQEQYYMREILFTAMERQKEGRKGGKEERRELGRTDGQNTHITNKSVSFPTKF